MLSEHINHLSQWNGLGLVDFSEILPHLQSDKDWRDNFSLLKTKRREVSNIPDQIKTEFFLIQLHSLKDSLEEKMKQVLDGLILALKHSIKQDIDAIQLFIDQSS